MTRGEKKEMRKEWEKMRQQRIDDEEKSKSRRYKLGGKSREQGKEKEG